MPLAALATMHGKERALGPLLRDALGWTVVVPTGLDTDAFGTFTGERPRQGSAWEAARAKARRALELRPDVDIAVSSEGSFGPHPEVPFLPGGHELVLALDRRSGIEVWGQHLTTATNYREALVGDEVEATAFARAAGFPDHALIVSRCADGDLAAAVPMAKGLVEEHALASALRALLARDGRALLSTDMRAHLNPTRMEAIAAAGRDLVARYRAVCPACGRPGFVVTEQIPGLGCADCGAPTRLWRAQHKRCAGCGHVEQEMASGSADPTWCDVCNP